MHPDRLARALEGRYGIERELGTGGMATVWPAEDLRHDRKVAVKVLEPELTALLGGDRFIQEITTIAGLQHPHILPLFDSEPTGSCIHPPVVQSEALPSAADARLPHVPPGGEVVLYRVP